MRAFCFRLDDMILSLEAPCVKMNCSSSFSEERYDAMNGRYLSWKVAFGGEGNAMFVS